MVPGKDVSRLPEPALARGAPQLPGRAESRQRGRPGRFQFERLGYFCVDPDSRLTRSCSTARCRCATRGRKSRVGSRGTCLAPRPLRGSARAVASSTTSPQIRPRRDGSGAAKRGAEARRCGAGTRPGVPGGADPARADRGEWSDRRTEADSSACGRSRCCSSGAGGERAHQPTFRPGVAEDCAGNSAIDCHSGPGRATGAAARTGTSAAIRGADAVRSARAAATARAPRRGGAAQPRCRPACGCACGVGGGSRARRGTSGARLASRIARCGGASSAGAGAAGGAAQAVATSPVDGGGCRGVGRPHVRGLPCRALRTSGARR